MRVNILEKGHRLGMANLHCFMIQNAVGLGVTRGKHWHLPISNMAVACQSRREFRAQKPQIDTNI